LSNNNLGAIILDHLNPLDDLSSVEESELLNYVNLLVKIDASYLSDPQTLRPGTSLDFNDNGFPLAENVLKEFKIIYRETPTPPGSRPESPQNN
jgi:hypothetical protein